MVSSNLERNQIYQDSELSWLGEVPAVWKLNRHKDNFSFISDRCTNPLLTKVGLENIESKTGRFIESDSEFDGDGVHFKIKDILFGKLRPYLAKVYLAEFEGNAIGDIFVYRTKKSISPRYASYLMLSDRYIDVINSSTSGAKMPRVSSDFIANLAVAVPSKEEQSQIVGYLDAKTEKIRSAIDLLSQKAERYRKLKQSLINESVTRGLDKTVAMKDSGIEWIGEVPTHWGVNRIADIAKQNKIKNIGTLEKNLLSLSYGRIIRKDFNSSFGLLPESFETYQIVKQGSIILRLTDLQNDQKSLRVGHVSEKGIITSAYLGLVFSKKINSKFAYYLLHVFDLCKVFYWFGGGLRSTMRYEDVKIIPFIIPPLIEQKVIADYLDDKTAKIDQVVVTINDQIEKLKELRKTLINDVVTGKIKVTNEGLAA